MSGGSSRISVLFSTKLPNRLDPEQHASTLEWAWASLAEFKSLLVHSEVYIVEATPYNLVQVREIDTDCLVWFSNYINNDHRRRECVRELQQLVTAHVEHAAHQHRLIEGIRLQSENRKRKWVEAEVIE